MSTSIGDQRTDADFTNDAHDPNSLQGGQQSNCLELATHGNIDTTNFTAREMPNFLLSGDTNNPTVICKGSEEALEALQSAVNAGFFQQATLGSQGLNLCFALEDALRGAHAADNRTTPTFTQINDIFNSSAYVIQVDEFTQLIEENLVTAQSFTDNNIPAEAAVQVLHLLADVGLSNGEVYRLGHVEKNSKDDILYVHLHETLFRRTPTKTAWIFKEPLSEDVWHWAGIAPSLHVLGADSAENISQSNLVVRNPKSDAASFDPLITYLAGQANPGASYIDVDSNKHVVNENFSEGKSHGNNDDDDEVRHLKIEIDDARGDSEELTIQGKRPGNRKREKTQEYLYRNGSIPFAPDADTALPFHLMEGITSHELLSFYPNHAIRYPAIAARLMAEGWLFAEIAQAINSSRGVSRNAAQKRKVVLENSIRHSIMKADDQFVKGLDRSDFERGFPSKSTFETTPWIPLDRQSTPPDGTGTLVGRNLSAPWSLRQLAQRIFDIWPHFTCSGPFTEKITAEIEELKAKRPGLFMNADPESMEAHNPPSLPGEWKLASDPTASRNICPGIDRPSWMLKPGGRHKVNVESILYNEDFNADAIIAKYPSQLEGSLLLWLLSRDGGQKTCTSIRRDLLRNHAVNSIHRSTISYRLKRALTQRATEKGTTYEVEKAVFATDEAYRERSGMPTQNHRNLMQHSSPDTQDDAAESQNVTCDTTGQVCGDVILGEPDSSSSEDKLSECRFFAKEEPDYPSTHELLWDLEGKTPHHHLNVETEYQTMHSPSQPRLLGLLSDAENVFFDRDSPTLAIMQEDGSSVSSRSDLSLSKIPSSVRFEQKNGGESRDAVSETLTNSNIDPFLLEISAIGYPHSSTTPISGQNAAEAELATPFLSRGFSNLDLMDSLKESLTECDTDFSNWVDFEGEQEKLSNEHENPPDPEPQKRKRSEKDSEDSETNQKRRRLEK